MNRDPGRVPGSGFPIATSVRDALYDRISLASPEVALISTPAFLRLDRIQQLGFVSRVWPGAKHTRYEHSLGVLHLTRLAVEHLRGTAEGQAVADEDARVAIAAALLHDIGHYPFSHAIEELGPPVLPHEVVGRGLIESAEIGSILRNDWDVDPQRVAAIVDPTWRELLPVDRLLRGVLSGALDMDKLDYLPRDARACNVPYGGVDTGRLIDALTVIDQTGEAEPSEPRVGIGEKGISPLHSLINARQEMFDNVYWHHTNRACMAMLLRAVQEAILHGAVSATELTGHDDASLLVLLASPAMPETTRHLTSALVQRRIHKRAVEISAKAFELYARLGNLYFDPVARRAVEIQLDEGLAAMTGQMVEPGAILIDIPKPERWRTDVWVRFERPPAGFRRVMPWREVVGFDDNDFKRYEEHRRLIRIVVAAPYREVVAAAWEGLVVPLIGGMV
ncbi:MAG: HD domain-containing protein [Chloroflexota bacterium]|nr:HD domain-containing protein [Chloroflexota bacterium]